MADMKPVRAMRPKPPSRMKSKASGPPREAGNQSSRGASHQEDSGIHADDQGAEWWDGANPAAKSRVPIVTTRITTDPLPGFDPDHHSTMPSPSSDDLSAHLIPNPPAFNSGSITPSAANQPRPQGNTPRLTSHRSPSHLNIHTEYLESLLQTSESALQAAEERERRLRRECEGLRRECEGLRAAVSGWEGRWEGLEERRLVGSVDWMSPAKTRATVPSGDRSASGPQRFAGGDQKPSRKQRKAASGSSVDEAGPSSSKTGAASTNTTPTAGPAPPHPPSNRRNLKRATASTSSIPSSRPRGTSWPSPTLTSTPFPSTSPTSSRWQQSLFPETTRRRQPSIDDHVDIMGSPPSTSSTSSPVNPFSKDQYRQERSGKDLPQSHEYRWVADVNDEDATSSPWAVPITGRSLASDLGDQWWPDREPQGGGGKVTEGRDVDGDGEAVLNEVDGLRVLSHALRQDGEVQWYPPFWTSNSTGGSMKSKATAKPTVKTKTRTKRTPEVSSTAACSSTSPARPPRIGPPDSPGSLVEVVILPPPAATTSFWSRMLAIALVIPLLVIKLLSVGIAVVAAVLKSVGVSPRLVDSLHQWIIRSIASTILTGITTATWISRRLVWWIRLTLFWMSGMYDGPDSSIAYRYRRAMLSR